MKISVVIPVHNNIQYLYQTLKSIENQTFKDYEVTIVDDCSYDPTAVSKVIGQFSFPHIQLIRHEVNKGPSAARNTGVKASRGEYIAFIDADDLYLPEKFRIQSEMLDQNADVGMVYSDEYVIPYGEKTYKTTPVQFPNGVRPPSGNILPAYIHRSFIAMFSVMVRRNVFDEFGGFDVKLIQAEDDDLWMKIGWTNKVLFSDYVSGVRRTHGHNISNDRRTMTYYQFQSFLNFKEEWQDGYARYENDFKLRARKALWSYTRYCFREYHIPDPRVYLLFLNIVS